MSFDVAVGEKQELQTFVLDPSMRVAILNESAFKEAAGLTEPIPAAGCQTSKELFSATPTLCHYDNLGCP